MGEEIIVLERTLKEKLLFYTTSFFVLLGTFSLFGFLFLVPFVIEPAFTTIFMEFDEYPASCVTVEVEHFKGASNCSWTSCREGCTRDIYECTQIRVNYKVNVPSNYTNETIYDEIDVIELDAVPAPAPPSASTNLPVKFSSNSKSNAFIGTARHKHHRIERGIREYDYVDGDEAMHRESNRDGFEFIEYSDGSEGGLMDNTSEWFFTGAKLFPNVKGCGYPPSLNCSIWMKKFLAIGTNFSW